MSTTLTVPNINDQIVQSLAGRDPHRLAGMWLSQFSSEETRKSYATSIRQWLDWCDRYDVDPFEVRRPHFDLWLRELEARGLKRNSQSARICAVKSFYAWLYDEEVLDGNPAGRVKIPKRERPVLPALTLGEAHRFVQAAETYRHPADAAALFLMLFGGLRVAEVCSRNVADLTVQNFVGLLDVLGKGSKRRRVELNPQTLAAIHRQLDDRAPGEPLIVNQAGRRVTKANVRDMVTRTAAAADIHKHLSPHCLRRSCIQLSLDAGQPVRNVQLYVGHASADTTAAYDKRELTIGKSPAYALQAAVA